MKDKLKAFALRIAFSRLGPTIVQLVSGAVGFLLGWIVNATSAIGFELSASQQTEVSLAITACIYWIISQIINNYAGKYSAELQEILKNANPLLKVDRWIGPETIAAAQDAAQKAAANPSTGEAAPEIYEGKPVAKLAAKPKPKRKPVIPYNPKR